MSSALGSQERQTRSSTAAAAALGLNEPHETMPIAAVESAVETVNSQEVAAIDAIQTNSETANSVSAECLGREKHVHSPDDDDSSSGLEGSEDDDDGDENCQKVTRPRRLSDLNKYKQRYLPSWELDSRLKEWLGPCPGDQYAAFCKFCQCKLHAHKKGLVVHSKSHKHKRHKLHPAPPIDEALLWDTTGGLNSSHSQNMTRALAIPEDADYSHLDDESLRKLRKRQFRRDSNVFQDKWLIEPIFASWIRKVPNNLTKALCIACRCLITSGRSELKKHTRSKKHKKAVLEGPFEELSVEQLERIFPDLYEYPTKQRKRKSNNSSRALDQTGDTSMYSLPTVPFNDRYIGHQMRPTSVIFPGLMLSEVLKRLEAHVPLFLAEKWDNVGILTRPTNDLKVHHILLTNDLNEKIAQEAIGRKAQFIITYHPLIFSPIKRLDPRNWKDKAMLMCIENKITVYSPHTALDAIKGGINDWLISPFLIDPMDKTSPIVHSIDNKYTSCLKVLVSENQEQIKEAFMNMSNVTMTEYGNSTDISVACDSKTLPQLVEQLTELSQNGPVHSKVSQLVAPPLPGIGMGRVATLTSPLPLYEVVQRAKSHLDLSQIRLALSPKHTRDTRITKIAVCAGSGGSVLKGCDADMWITGEMSHHEVLDAIHNGVSVILCEHSNTERGFFRDWSQQLKCAIFEEQVEVLISDFDRDPLKII